MKLNKFIMALIAVAVGATMACAAVQVQSGGTRVGLTETVNFSGPTVSESNGVTTVDSTALTGTIAVTGSVNTSTFLDADTYVHADTYVDADTYITSGTYMNSGSYMDANTYVHADTYMDADTYITSGTYMEADGEIYADSLINVDDSIYMTSTSASTGLFLKQSDGGCSRCRVADDGTTFACINIPCAAGQSTN